MEIAIGYIEKYLGPVHAEMKVLAYKDNQDWVTEEDKIIEVFSPKGCVIWYKFDDFKQYNLGDYVSFFGEKLPSVDEGMDETKVKSVKDKLTYEIIEIDNFLENGNSIKMEYLTDKIDILPEKFYIKDEYGYYGSFKVEHSKVIPKKGQSVGYRKEIKYQIKHNQKIFVYEQPKYEKLIDASYLEQKFKWFKGILNSNKSGFYKTILENTNWKEDIIYLGDSLDEVENAKIASLIENIENINLSIKDIEAISNASQDFKDLFLLQVQKFKNEIIENQQSEIDIELEEYKKQIGNIKKEFDKETNNLNKTKEQVSEEKTKLEYIEKNKERLLTDFKVFQSLGNKRISTQVAKRPYVVENKCADSNDLTENELFNNCIINLKKVNIFCNKPKKIKAVIEMISSYNCCLIKDDETRLIIPIIKACNNYKYIVSYVEPKWLNFNDLYESGLREIWQSSYDNPDMLHFLILKGMNISSPECYAPQLSDLNSSILSKLPIDNRPWPNNLRIIGSVVPDDIGLKITEYAFSNWGGINRIEYTENEEKANLEYVEKKFSVKAFIDMENMARLKNNIDEFYT
jgi:hypothetical protein